MIYLLALLAVAALLGGAALAANLRNRRAADARVGIATLLGSLMLISSAVVAQLIGVGAPVQPPLIDRLFTWAIIAMVLCAIVALVELVAGRLAATRRASWLAAGCAAVLLLTEAVLLLRMGLVIIWPMVEFAFVAVVTGFAWWTGLPAVNPAKERAR